MIERLFRTNQSARTRRPRGFALVVTLSLMILLTVIAVGLLALSSISLRASTQGQAMAIAQANARMALMLAIGELQKSAGPDQRITAAADILPAAKPAAPGRAHWTGVWDTSAFNPASPNTKAFVRWLVSDNPSAPADATATASADDVLAFQGKDAATSVRVPKVTVTGGAYAYWVEDEGLKADLGWSEGKFTDNQRKQSARLTAAPGPDHGTFDGPFSGKTNYPVTKTAGNPWLDNLDKALSTADLPLVMSDTASQSIWLRDSHHDMTLGSHGVLADVKLGGLRRDLSLAFEMDGNSDITATEKPPLFNKQVGEFVGGTDRLAAPKAALGMGDVKERYLYRDMKGSGTPFSGDIVTPNSVVRGPNWWALRDYANLYKRLKGSGGN
jgi:Tfp pilus assembly protein PilX